MTEQPAEKIPCIQCGAMILPRTAERWGGLCGPCDTRRESGLAPPNMELDLTPKQLKHLLSITKAIFGDDSKSQRAFEAALNDWKAFYAANPGFGYNAREGAPVPFDLLIDSATVAGYVFEADWCELNSDILAGIRSLPRCRDLDVNWDDVSSGDDEEVGRFITEVTDLLVEHDVALVILERFGDSYPLSTLPLASLGSARESARKLGEPYVILASDPFP